MANSLDAGDLVTLPSIASIATSLGARTVSRQVFERCRELGPERVQPFVTTDEAAIGSCIWLARDHRVLVEPACGAAIAAVIERSPALSGCKLVVVEVCGGALVDVAALTAWARDLGVSLDLES